ncbi:MAG: DUF1365 domain-containing protein [Pseudomonadota bacterium]
MNAQVDHIAGVTFHGRKGAVSNAFRYSVDYVMVDAEAPVRAPRLFRRNGRGLLSLNDSDHGGAPQKGRGARWVRDVLDQHQIKAITRIDLVAQPKVLGHVFNPVSFWLCWRGEAVLTAVIAEVNNTYGDRHSYLCCHSDHRPIKPSDTLTASKIFHVSPFQPVDGGYKFRFDISDDRIGIWIDYSRNKGGLIATLIGKRRALDNRAILSSALRRPFGSRRVLALIHWQALKLWAKGAVFRSRPEPPAKEISRS